MTPLIGSLLMRQDTALACQLKYNNLSNVHTLKQWGKQWGISAKTHRPSGYYYIL